MKKNNTMKFSDIEYTRLNIDQIVDQIDQMTAVCVQDATLESLVDSYTTIEKIESAAITMASYVSLRYSDNTADEFFKGEYIFIMQNSPTIESKLNNYFNHLVKSQFKNELRHKIGPTRFKILENAALSSNEETIQLDKEINALVEAYQTLTSQASFEVDEQQYNPMSLMKLMTDKDRQLRKKAFEADSDFYKKHKDKIADIFDSLVKLRNKKARLLGYDNYADYSNIAMNRIGYNTTDIGQYREHAAKYLSPLFDKIRQHRKADLQLDHLKYYDESILFSDGNPVPQGDYASFMEKVVQMYEELSTETGEFIHRMIDNELLLVENKPNKIHGGFATMLPQYKFTPILTSLTQSTFDFVVMTHELGHSFQMDSAFRHGAIANPLPTIDVAEIFSHTMEFLTLRWIDLFFGKEATKYQLFNINRAYSMLNTQCIGDEFQEIIYKNENLTDDERNQVYLSLTEKYNARRDYDDNEYAAAGNSWKSNSHIITIPFYYIDYALATYVSIHIWKIIKQDFKKGWDLYIDLCNKSHTLCYGDIITELGIPSPFIEEHVKDISQFLAQEIDAIMHQLQLKPATA